MPTPRFRSALLSVLLLANAGLQLGCRLEQDRSSDATVPRETQVLSAEERPKLAFVTNGIANFWTVAEAGANKAAADFNAEVTVQKPENGAGDQKRILEELLAKGMHGIAVSPVHPGNQADILNQVAAATNYITHDSDAPNTDRLAYIGMDNYVAGRMCGEAVKRVLPDGGEVMIFVGRLGQLNADLRRQGLIDALFDRDSDSSRRDPTGKVLTGGKYSVLDTRTDDFDAGRAKSQAEDAIVTYPNLGCMVGLFDYNPPAILEALRANDKIGKIKVVAFDEREETLQAIVDGECYATIVQDPYNYGYKSVELLAKLSRGDRSMLPTADDKLIDIPARTIGKAEVDEFWSHLKSLLAAAEAP